MISARKTFNVTKILYNVLASYYRGITVTFIWQSVHTLFVPILFQAVTGCYTGSRIETPLCGNCCSDPILDRLI